MKNPFARKDKSDVGKNPRRRSLLCVANIPAALTFMVFGLGLLIAPVVSSKIITLALAAVLALCGIYYVITYFMTERLQAAARQDFTLGLTLIAGGVLLFIKPEIPENVLPYIWGGALIIGGFAKTQLALDMYRLNSKKWWHALIGAGIALILGIITALDPFATDAILLKFIGGGLLAEGLMDGYCWFIFDKLQKSLNNPPAPEKK